MQRNKVNSVTVIAAVAQQLGVDEDLLHDLSVGLERRDGLIRVLGLGEHSVLAFTAEGVDEVQLILMEYNRIRPSKP